MIYVSRRESSYEHQGISGRTRPIWSFTLGLYLSVKKSEYERFEEKEEGDFFPYE